MSVAAPGEYWVSDNVEKTGPSEQHPSPVFLGASLKRRIREHAGQGSHWSYYTLCSREGGVKGKYDSSYRIIGQVLVYKCYLLKEKPPTSQILTWASERLMEHVCGIPNPISLEHFCVVVANALIKNWQLFLPRGENAVNAAHWFFKALPCLDKFCCCSTEQRGLA